ncbi:MAG TPA: ABC transporter ATP-binding protein [Ignavibacteria bacterium]|nr:ABC transporter ATP-binding protein [Ignavibacteria bacterium]HMR40466.1 ABC transporter ATP-binding protein [Ignavibacteria bacterium]
MNTVQFKDISISFGSCSVLENVSLNIKSNSVHCILGENGAGKSSLMKVLFGMYQPDSGEFFINGKIVHFSSPLDSINMKIGMVHQHFMLISDFTVLENVILGNEITDGLKINFSGIRSILSDIINKYNLGLDLDSKISDLSISSQQKVEILKLLFRDSEILIFDEPTAVLSPVEVKEFFKIIEEFKRNKKTIILITHKLNEVKLIADRVTVLRKGRVVYEEDITDCNIDLEKLALAIVGESRVSIAVDKSSENLTNEIVVRLNNIDLYKNSVKILDKMNLSLRKGEVLGICGVEGNGQNEIAEIITGLEKNFEGEYKNKNVNVSMVPDDRISKGMISQFNVGENIYLKNGKKFIASSELLDDFSDKTITEYDVRLTNNKASLGSLSGGNQQKVIIAREISAGNEVLIFSHPTRGVDINATAFIHSKIIEERNKNRAVLLISSDLDELISLSDRLCVLFKGKIIRTFESDELSSYKSDNKVSLTPDIEIKKEKDNQLFELLGKLMIGMAD